MVLRGATPHKTLFMILLLSYLLTKVCLVLQLSTALCKELTKVERPG